MSRLLPLAVVLAAVGCGTPAPPPNAKTTVVATFSVIGHFAETVADGKVNVVTLVGPDGDAHTFEPTPKDAETVALAEVVLENGLGFETWLDKAIASSGSRARRIVVTKGITPRTAQGHGGPEVDPHVWHEVGNAKVMVGGVRDGLIAADPANAEHYRTKAAEVLKQLDALDAWVVAEVTKLPPANRKLVTNHDTFGYFAARHNFTVVGQVLPSFSTEAADPSAAAFAQLIAAVKAEKVKAVFADASHNPKLAERLATEAGVTFGAPLFTDALGNPGSGGETYDGMIRHNVSAIVKALAP